MICCCEKCMALAFLETAVCLPKEIQDTINWEYAINKAT